MLRGVDGSGNDASRNRCYTIKVETGVTFLCLSLPHPLLPPPPPGPLPLCSLSFLLGSLSPPRAKRRG